MKLLTFRSNMFRIPCLLLVAHSLLNQAVPIHHRNVDNGIYVGLRARRVRHPAAFEPVFDASLADIETAYPDDEAFRDFRDNSDDHVETIEETSLEKRNSDDEMKRDNGNLLQSRNHLIRGDSETADFTDFEDQNKRSASELDNVSIDKDMSKEERDSEARSERNDRIASETSDYNEEKDKRENAFFVRKQEGDLVSDGEVTRDTDDKERTSEDARNKREDEDEALERTHQTKEVEEERKCLDDTQNDADDDPRDSETGAPLKDGAREAVDDVANEEKREDTIDQDEYSVHHKRESMDSDQEERNVVRTLNDIMESSSAIDNDEVRDYRRLVDAKDSDDDWVDRNRDRDHREARDDFEYLESDDDDENGIPIEAKRDARYYQENSNEDLNEDLNEELERKEKEGFVLADNGNLNARSFLSDDELENNFEGADKEYMSK